MIREILLVLVSVSISVAVTLFISPKTPRIVVVNKDEIFRTLIVEIQKATSGDNEKTLMLRMEKYKNATELLDKEMEKLAREKNFIIFSRNNVLGGDDVTDQAKLLLSDLIKERGGHEKTKE